MRESVFVRVNGALNRQHVRGSKSHVPPSIGPSFAPHILQCPTVNLFVECNQVGYRCLHYCSGKRRDCNQRLITIGWEAAIAGQRCWNDGLAGRRG
jgi:hypothetical protein